MSFSVTGVTKRVFVLLVVLAILGPAVVQGYELGDTVADFTFSDLNGTPRTLYEHHGDIIVLNFFTTWCVFCNREAPSLENDIWQPYRDYGVTVIGLNVRESLEVVQDWYADMGLTYEVLMLPNIFLPYRFPNHEGVPQNVVLDTDMVLRYSELGYDQLAIEDMLNSILGFDPFDSEQETWGRIKAMFR